MVLHALEAFLISTRHRLRGSRVESETCGQETRSLGGGAAMGDAFTLLPLEQEIFDYKPLGRRVPPATCLNRSRACDWKWQGVLEVFEKRI